MNSQNGLKKPRLLRPKSLDEKTILAHARMRNHDVYVELEFIIKAFGHDIKFLEFYLEETEIVQESLF